jgi:hypothetical protein
MSQATMEQASPQIKQAVINSPSDLRKIKRNGVVKRSMSMEEIKMFSK